MDDRVKEFARSLRDAIVDKKLEESGAEVNVIFDADVAVGTVFAAEEMTSSRLVGPRAELHKRDLFVRLLWYTGAIGAVWLALPHRFEFDSVMRSRKTGGIEGLEGLSVLLSDLLKQDDRDSAVLLMQEANRQSPESRRRFASEFARVGPLIGMMVDAGASSWHQRRRTLGKVMQPEGLGQPLSQTIAQTDDFFELVLEKVIAERKPPPSEDLPHPPRESERQWFRNLIDSAVISQIADLTSSQSASTHQRYYRFFTNTSSLVSVCLKYPEISERLGAPRDIKSWLRGGIAESDAFPIRTTTYFLIRAAFPTLAFPGASSEVTPLYSVERADLERVSDELSGLLERQTSPAGKMWAKKLGPRSLRALVYEFTTFACAHSFWKPNAKYFADRMATAAESQTRLEHWLPMWTTVASFDHDVVVKEGAYASQTTRLIARTNQFLSVLGALIKCAQKTGLSHDQVDGLTAEGDLLVKLWFAEVDKEDYTRAAGLVFILLDPAQEKETRKRACARLLSLGTTGRSTKERLIALSLLGMLPSPTLKRFCVDELQTLTECPEARPIGLWLRIPETRLRNADELLALLRDGQDLVSDKEIQNPLGAVHVALVLIEDYFRKWKGRLNSDRRVIEAEILNVIVAARHRVLDVLRTHERGWEHSFGVFHLARISFIRRTLNREFETKARSQLRGIQQTEFSHGWFAAFLTRLDFLRADNAGEDTDQDDVALGDFTLHRAEQDLRALPMAHLDRFIRDEIEWLKQIQAER